MSDRQYTNWIVCLVLIVATETFDDTLGVSNPRFGGSEFLKINHQYTRANPLRRRGVELAHGETFKEMALKMFKRGLDRVGKGSGIKNLPWCKKWVQINLSKLSSQSRWG